MEISTLGTSMADSTMLETNEESEANKMESSYIKVSDRSSISGTTSVKKRLTKKIKAIGNTAKRRLVGSDEKPWIVGHKYSLLIPEENFEVDHLCFF